MRRTARLDRVVRRREAPALIVIMIVLADRRRLSALRRQPQIRPRLFARLDAGGDENIQRLRLLQRIDRVVADVR